MARAHIRTISTTYSHWPTESIMSSRFSPPTLRSLVRAHRDAGTMFHNIPPLSLTNPIASTIRTHFTSQDTALLSSLRDRATHITDPHTYKQAYHEFSPRKTHTSLLPRLNPLWQNHITTWPQVLLRATPSSFILKSSQSISKLTGSDTSLTIPVRLLAAILTEPTDTIHNRLPVTNLNIKQASLPTTLHPSWIPLLNPHLPRLPSTLSPDTHSSRTTTTTPTARITHIDTEYLTPTDHHYPPCDVTRIISKHKDTEYGQTQYMVEWAPEHLTEWDIQLQLDEGFRLISSTPTSVTLPPPPPLIAPYAITLFT